MWPPSSRPTTRRRALPRSSAANSHVQDACTVELAPIGRAVTPYLTKFGVPRQPELARSCPCALVFEHPDAAEFLADVREGSTLLVVWGFSKNARSGAFRSTVRPPRLGGSQRVGVFASRSSFRPNGLALSRVTACGHVQARDDGTCAVRIAGADMVDGSPVYDIAPYVPVLDCHEQAASGWVGRESWHALALAPIDSRMLALVDEAYRDGLLELLALDPRPAYARSSGSTRSYWVAYGDVVVDFRVEAGVLSVTSIQPLDEAMRAELAATGTLSGRFEQR